MLSEDRIDLDGKMASAAAEPTLNLPSERPGSGAEFDHDGFAAFG